MQTASRVSIAMCTFNSERFLQEQLSSFALQTALPHELVVQDDGSVDATLTILERFAKGAPFPVTIAQNGSRLGPTGNFEASMSRCSGDIVAFSDADDIWLPDKIEAARKRLDADRSLCCVLADAQLVSEDASPLGRTLWESVGFTECDQVAFERGNVLAWLLRRNMAFGCTMAIRRSLLDVVLPIPRPWGHDNWIALVSAGMARVGLVRRPLLRYRQHRLQCSGAGGVGVRRRVRAALTRDPGRDWIPRGSSFDALARRLREHRELSDDPEQLESLASHAERKARHVAVRENLPSGFVGRSPAVIRALLRFEYHRYSNGLRSALRDLAFGSL